MSARSSLQKAVVMAFVALSQSRPAEAGSPVLVQVSGGGAWNVRTTLAIRQEGHEEIETSASFATRPLEQPLYWAVRLSLEDRKGAWELQLLHHKLYLENPPEGVASFEATHGFNLLTLGRATRVGSSFSVRGAVGVVVAHTESMVRGVWEGGSGSFSGYEIAGPAAIVGAGYTVPLGSRVFATAEVAVSAARARVGVADGHATFWNVAGHALAGLGVRLGSRAR